MIDIQISSPYVATGQHHKVRKVTNSGTRLCSYVLETKNMVISKQYTLKTSNSREGILKMVSEFSPAGPIGAGIPTSTILLEVILGDPPDDFVEVLPGFKLVDQRACTKRTWDLHQSSGATCGALYLGGIQHEAEHRFLDISKIHVFFLLIVLGFNDMSTLVGHFVSSPRERGKSDRRDSRRDEREEQGRKRNRNESEETEEIKTFPLYPYLLQG